MIFKAGNRVRCIDLTQAHYITKTDGRLITFNKGMLSSMRNNEYRVITCITHEGQCKVLLHCLGPNTAGAIVIAPTHTIKRPCCTITIDRCHYTVPYEVASMIQDLVRGETCGY